MDRCTLLIQILEIYVNPCEISMWISCDLWPLKSNQFTLKSKCCFFVINLSMHSWDIALTTFKISGHRDFDLWPTKVKFLLIRVSWTWVCSVFLTAHPCLMYIGVQFWRKSRNLSRVFLRYDNHMVGSHEAPFVQWASKQEWLGWMQGSRPS